MLVLMRSCLRHHQKTHIGFRCQLVSLRVNLPVPFIAKAGGIWVGLVGSRVLVPTTGYRLLLQRRRPGTVDTERNEQRWKMHVACQLVSIEGEAKLGTCGAGGDAPFVRVTWRTDDDM
jgi:hypothetical protein